MRFAQLRNLYAILRFADNPRGGRDCGPIFRPFLAAGG
jgi:hypothetical protein